MLYLHFNSNQYFSFYSSDSNNVDREFENEVVQYSQNKVIRSENMYSITYVDVKKERMLQVIVQHNELGFALCGYFKMNK